MSSERLQSERCNEVSKSTEKLIVAQHFMEPGCSLPCSQAPASGPRPEPDECSSHPLTLFL
jgi:hypothetical protein